MDGWLAIYRSPSFLMLFWGSGPLTGIGADFKETIMVKKGRSSFIAAALSILMLISSGLILPMASPAEPQAGTNFSLRALNGSTVSSANTRGKVVVFAVGATWVPLSRAQLQALRQLADEYS